MNKYQLEQLRWMDVSKRKVYPKRDYRNKPLIQAGRVLRNIPNLSFNQYANELKREIGVLPKLQMTRSMYDDYLYYQEDGHKHIY